MFKDSIEKKKLTFGIVSHDFSREFTSPSGIASTVNQHKGQMFITDGDFSKHIDGFMVVALSNKASKAKELLTNHFYEELSMYQHLKEQCKAENIAFSLNNISWSANLNSYPVTWFDDFSKALALHEMPPKHGNISVSVLKKAS